MIGKWTVEMIVVTLLHLLWGDMDVVRMNRWVGDRTTISTDGPQIVLQQEYRFIFHSR